MKARLVLLFLFTCFISLYAQDMIVGVAEFENYSGAEQLSSLQKGISDAVINRLLSLEGLFVVERNRFGEVMRELELGMSGLMSDISVQKVGKALSAGIIVVGGYEYNAMTKMIRINARVVQVETGLILTSESLIDQEIFTDDLQQGIGDKVRDYFVRKYGMRIKEDWTPPKPGSVVFSDTPAPPEKKSEPPGNLEEISLEEEARDLEVSPVLQSEDTEIETSFTEPFLNPPEDLKGYTGLFYFNERPLLPAAKFSQTDDLDGFVRGFYLNEGVETQKKKPSESQGARNE